MLPQSVTIILGKVESGSGDGRLGGGGGGGEFLMRFLRKQMDQ